MTPHSSSCIGDVTNTFRALGALVQRATSTTPGPAAVYEVLSSIDASTATTLPSTRALRMRLYRQRRRNIPINPSSSQGFTIPLSFSSTLRSEPFLFADRQFLGQRMLLFCSMADLKHLASADTIFADGTFQIAPRHFQQIYTLHCSYGGVVYPRLYAFLTCKTAQIYRALLRELRDYVVNT